MVSRETIFWNLFNQLVTLAVQANPSDPNKPYTLPKQANPPFNWADRRYTPMGGLQALQYPALMMVERGIKWERELIYGPGVAILIVHVIVQSFNPDPNSIPAVAMNNLGDAVQNCIETGAGQFPAGANTLAVVGAAPSAQNMGVRGGTPRLVQLVRMSGEERFWQVSKEGTYSEADMEIEIILPDN